MKKILVIILLLGIIGFSFFLATKKNNIENTFIGKWYYTSSTSRDIYEFDKDNCTITKNNEKNKFKYSFTSDKLILENDLEKKEIDYYFKGIYLYIKIDNNFIKLTKNGDVIKNTVNEIDSAKNSSYITSAYGYIDAIEKRVMISGLSTSEIQFKLNQSYDIETLKKLDVSIRGIEPNSGYVYIDSNGIVKDAVLKYENVYVVLENGNYNIVDNYDIPEPTCRIENKNLICN